MYAPLAGSVIPLAEVPDPAFGLLGAGVAVEPAGQGEVTARAPISGTLLTLRSHAFAILDDQGRAVLVHLGIDTAGLRDGGFTRLRAKGDRIRVGEPVTRWNLTALAGRSPLCPVIALEAPEVTRTAAGTVQVGDRLFVWNNSPSKEDHG
ncbi:PTS glucose transporter subunit IIA [Actinocorallia longicatena]|uniref:PTS glucose transporter subunit IIA n=1 Tax=Actinocorallia longicatena TaxID=111803 RepID=A0ABP6QLE2_9ACTN